MVSDNGCYTHFIMAKRQNDKIGAVLYDSPRKFEGCKSKRGLLALETLIFHQEKINILFETPFFDIMKELFINRHK